ncbi:MAG: hypothetical protein QF926_00455 [Alphaproteobacteria bacterium]|jgi:hypothetical protein|nr:hypothetical protein [Alphaproteobacteria bacterium]MDP6515080.1 hypothetical protein [Alphaproteobacteria bacterium]|tara:strand:- start:795 stop:1121 length:327 start_codon:yes stop_codon:yes gene_type:complete
MKRIKRLLIASAVVPISLALTGAVPNAAQAAVCMPHEAAVANLEQKFGEQVAGVGLAGRGQSLVELFVGSNGSWTILVTRTNGIACVASSGEDWTDLPRATKASEAPA